eukprot:6135658-Amphidinium_carterae.1
MDNEEEEFYSAASADDQTPSAESEEDDTSSTGVPSQPGAPRLVIKVLPELPVGAQREELAVWKTGTPLFQRIAGRKTCQASKMGSHMCVVLKQAPRELPFETAADMDQEDLFQSGLVEEEGCDFELYFCASTLEGDIER